MSVFALIDIYYTYEFTENIDYGKHYLIRGKKP
jgi:hypothetical protein